MREDAMGNARNWASGLATAVLILLAPIIGFAVVVAGEMLIDVLARLGPPVVWPVAAAAVGWVLMRKYGWQPRTAQLRSGGA